MSIKFTKLSSILLITTISCLFACNAKAEEATARPRSVSETFQDAYFEHTGDNYDNSGIVKQLNTIFGFQGFPDNQISADGKLVDEIYQDVLRGQSRAGSPIKTRDLKNPYSTSLQENPSYIGY